jgi:hypothetical protein
VSERLSGRDSADVGVEVAIVPAGWLDVHIHSRNPVMWLHTGVELHPDGRVLRPPADDGCTPVGTPHELVGTAGSVPAAVDLVVAQAEPTIAFLTKRIDEALDRRLPTAQPPVSADDLAKACELWQSGQDVGSSFLRGADRALTGIPHYFRSDFITDQEQKARRSPEALHAGIVLLRGVNSAERRNADGWSAVTGLPLRGFAGRGLAAKSEDDQILEQLARGEITMPLWGVSLDPAVANGFGTRLLLEIVGEFPAVPAWVASGVKEEEQELITGGRYRVLSMTEDGGTTHVRLQWFGAAGDRVGSDDVLLGVLGALDGVWRSELTRSAGGSETLTVRPPGQGNWAEIEHAAAAPTARVTRYYEPEPDPNARDDSEWTQYAAIQAASRQMTVPADVESIVAAVLTER